MTEPSEWAQREAAAIVPGPGPKYRTLVARALDAARRKGIEEAAARAERYFSPAHTYASENADVYFAQDDAQKRIAAAIRSLADKGPA